VLECAATMERRPMAAAGGGIFAVDVRGGRDFFLARTRQMRGGVQDGWSPALTYRGIVWAAGPSRTLPFPALRTDTDTCWLAVVLIVIVTVACSGWRNGNVVGRRENTGVPTGGSRAFRCYTEAPGFWALAALPASA